MEFLDPRDLFYPKVSMLGILRVGIGGILGIFPFPAVQSQELFPIKRWNSLCGKTKGHSRDEQTIPKDFPWEFRPRIVGQEKENSQGIWGGILRGKKRKNKEGKIPQIPVKNQFHKF